MGALAVLLAWGTPALTAETPVLVPMGYASLGPDGQPRGIQVALTRADFTALVAAATATPAGPSPVASLVVGTGTWQGTWADGRWRFTGSLPVASLGAEFAHLDVPVAGAVERADFTADGAATPVAVPWQIRAGVLALTLPPRQQGTLTIVLAADRGDRTSLPLPARGPGVLTVTLPAGETLVDAQGRSWGRAMPLPAALAADGAADVRVRPETAAVDVGTLGLDQQVRLQHLGDRVAWTAEVTIDGQRGAPDLVTLTLPDGLDVLTATSPGLTTWQQADGRLALRWGGQRTDGGPARHRRIHLEGVLIAGTAVAPALHLPGAARGGGAVAVVAAGPVAWLPAESVLATHPNLERQSPAADERYRLTWAVADPGVLRLSWAAIGQTSSVGITGLLVAGSGRWRADVAVRLSGRGLVDHLDLTVPAPWRVVDVAGCAWTPLADGHLVLRDRQAFAPGRTLILRLEAPADPAPASVPVLAVGDGLDRGIHRWLVADDGRQRLETVSPGHDGAALAAELTALGIPLRPGESARTAVDFRGTGPGLRLVPAHRRISVQAAHYLRAGSTVRWASHLTITPDEGTLDRFRLRLPAGAQVTARRGEGVADWTEQDGWLTARFAAPLDRPTALDLEFALAWTEVRGRDHLEIPGLVCDPPAGATTVALAEDDDAGQLIRHPDGLEEHAASLLPLEVQPHLLASRTWTATSPTWSLGLDRERLDPGSGVDGVATLVDATSVLDPDRTLVSRATWYVINRSRTALTLALPADCTLWEVRVGGQPVRPRVGTADGAGGSTVLIPVPPLRPGEAAARIQVCWRQTGPAPGVAEVRPLLPAFREVRVMRALWAFTAPAGQHLAQVDGWEPVAQGDATGARVEVLADEIKRLQATGADFQAVRLRLGDQLRLIDQELADHLAVLERLGEDPTRWTGDLAVRHDDLQQQQVLIQRNQGYNSLAQENRRDLQVRLEALSSVARQQQDRRRGLLLDALAVRWPAPGMPAGVAQVGPDWAPPLAVPAPDRTGEDLRAQILAGRVAGREVKPGTTPGGTLLGIDLVPAQEGERLTLRADALGVQPVLRLTPAARDGRWWPGLLGVVAVLLAGAALVRRGTSPHR